MHFGHINSQNSKEIYVSKYSAMQLQNKLEKIYSQRSSDSLMIFIREWNNLVPPQNNSFNKTFIDRNINQIINSLFQKNTKRSTLLEDKFFIFNYKINYNIISAIKFKKLKNNLLLYKQERSCKKTTFIRPTIKSINPQRLLLLTDEYKAAIDSFVEKDLINYKNYVESIQSINENVLHKYNQIKYEYRQKIKFLQTYLPIVEGARDGIIIESFPSIYNVIFDDKFQNAYVDYLDSFNFCILQLKVTKRNGRWVLTKETAFTEIE
jgi:hypothetical protein